MSGDANSVCPPSATLLREILDRATVPEHSAVFMQAMSGGTPFVVDRFLFLSADDWLMAVGYPLAESGGPEELSLEDAANPAIMPAFEAALDEALNRTSARDCWVVAPDLPESLTVHEDNRDAFYILDADAPVPGPLRGPISAARKRLRVTENEEFTPEHRRLWAEFLSRTSMRPNVRELYARTEAALAAAASFEKRPGSGGTTNPPLLDLRLLSAWDTEGRLTASLLLDYSPNRFCSYIIGAHSRKHYSPHATDLLFAVMLERCREQGKRFIHLGLGVSDGIARFKRKWGGRSALPYLMAGWSRNPGSRESRSISSANSEIGDALRSFLQTPPDMSKQQIFDSFPKQRTFAMIREVEKNGAVSYLCGTAHFFCYSFELSFRRIFEPLHTVIFEGPLDEGFLAAVERVGRNPDPGARVIDGLSEDDVRRLERIVYGPEGVLPGLLGLQRERRVDVRALLAETRPWFAFFTLWVAFLERQGWSQSVDLEAWATARDMGKAVVGMENLDEQIASLEAVPFARIIDFFRRCDQWPSYMRRNIRSYLAGDLEQMMGSSIEFPSRTEMVIGFRDGRFFERMLPFMEAGNCAVFVGTAHLLGLVPMLEDAGYRVRPAYFGLGLRLRARMRDLFGF